MVRFRFSLLGLAGLVTLIAVGCASLVYASAWLAAAICWATMLVLMFATLAALLRTPPQRCWWIGFALFGWIVMLVFYGPLWGLQRSYTSRALLEQLALAMPKATIKETSIDHYEAGMGVDPGMGMDAGMGGQPEDASSAGMGTTTWAPIVVLTQDTAYISAFVEISQALIALLLACIGGVTGGLIERRNRRRQET